MDSTVNSKDARLCAQAARASGRLRPARVPLAAFLLTLASVHTSSARAEAGEALAAANGCAQCHAVTARKKGPSYKATASEWRGAGVTVAKAAALIRDRHDDLKINDADLRALAAWILTL